MLSSSHLGWRTPMLFSSHLGRRTPMLSSSLRGRRTPMLSSAHRGRAPVLSSFHQGRAPVLSSSHRGRAPVLSSSHRGRRTSMLSSSHRGRRAPMLSSSMLLAPMLPGEGMGGVRLPCTCSYRQDAHPPGSGYRRQTPLLPSCYPPVWEAISRLPGSGVGARGCLVCPDSRRRSV